MNPEQLFAQERRERIENYHKNERLVTSSKEFLLESLKSKYSYNFTWMGRPIIQYPQDMIAMQEIIWKVKPDLIIETGIAHGGSLIYYASILELIGKGQVLGIDIDIRQHNRIAIEKHAMYKRISMIENSSISTETISEVKNHIKDDMKIIVALDSNHTHDHVIQELNLYSDFVSKESYLIVFDTIVQDAPNELWGKDNWGKNDNPKTAVHDFLKNNSNFVIAHEIEQKLLITVNPDGFLKRVS